MARVQGKGKTEDFLGLHVFRVNEGLGNACVLEFPDKTCGILDWGTQEPEPLEEALNIARQGYIRFVAASHAHADHTLGLEKLLRECNRRKIRIEKFVYPATTLHIGDDHLTAARKAAAEFKIDMSSIGVDDLQRAGEWRPPALAWGVDEESWEVRVLSPSLRNIAKAEMRAFGREVVPGNETSLVVLFRFLGQKSAIGLGRALLPGDATPGTLAFARDTGKHFPELVIDNQAFLVPHHGSQHNLPVWVKTHIHGVVVVSAPTDSPHHPSQKTLELLGNWTHGSDRLFCTAYAQCCAKAFGTRAAPNDPLVEPGNCFGNVVIRVPRSAPAALTQSSAPGHQRRPYGYCGNAQSNERVVIDLP